MERAIRGFTLIELLVVVAIISILASVILATLNDVREKAKIAKSVADQKQIETAIELYHSDMGFYPPDVNRGWDPGFVRSLPYNQDTGQDCSVNPADCPPCGSACPEATWKQQVQEKWKGPYLNAWQTSTAWGGKYDFNYWDSPTVRYHCVQQPLPPGIYVGVQRDYNDQHGIPEADEQEMIDKGLDADQCIDGEAQMLLWKF